MSENKQIDMGFRMRACMKFLQEALLSCYYVVAVLHRRCGKTYQFVANQVSHALHNPLPNPVYSYIAPTRERAFDIAWKYYKKFIGNVADAFVNVRFIEGDMKIVIHRQQKARDLTTGKLIDDEINFTIYGGMRTDVITGMYQDVVILDEMQELNPILLQKAIPPLTDRRKQGSQIGFLTGCLWISGTFRGKCQLHTIYANWLEEMKLNPEYFAYLLPASKSGVFTDEELADIKKQIKLASLSTGVDADNYYLQEYELEVDNIVLPGYPLTFQLMKCNEKGNMGHFPAFSNLPTVASCDIGRDGTVFWFWQYHNGIVYCVDCLHFEGSSTLDITIQKAVNELGYILPVILAPHDTVNVKDSMGQTSSYTRLKKMFPNTSIVVRPRMNGAVDNRIIAMNNMIPDMRINTHNVRVFEGVEKLRQYRLKFDEKTSSTSQPIHNVSSHYADGFGEFCVNFNALYFQLTPLQKMGNDTKLYTADEQRTGNKQPKLPSWARRRA